MKTLFSRIAIILISIFMLSSCELNDDSKASCSYFTGVGTNSVTGPITAALNEEIDLSVKFNVVNNCGSFYLFNEVSSGTNEKTITVNAIYEGCDCNTITTEKTSIYKFKSASAGVYVLKFKITNETFITHTITVE